MLCLALGKQPVPQAEAVLPRGATTLRCEDPIQHPRSGLAVLVHDDVLVLTHVLDLGDRALDALADLFLALSEIDGEPYEMAARFGASGYVVESVPLAIYSAQKTQQRSLEDVLKGAIEAGGDTDTVASMTGQIAGAAVGGSVVPDDLLEGIALLDEARALATRFAQTISEIRP